MIFSSKCIRTKMYTHTCRFAEKVILYLRDQRLACIHQYIQNIYIHAYKNIDINDYKNIDIHACMHLCYTQNTRSSITRARCRSLSRSMYIYIYILSIYVRIHIYIYIHVYMYTCIRVHLPAYPAYSRVRTCNITLALSRAPPVSLCLSLVPSLYLSLPRSRARALSLSLSLSA